MKPTREIYLLRMFEEDEGVVEIHMYAPDDESALDNAQQGFERSFEFIGFDDELGIKILEEKINE